MRLSKSLGGFFSAAGAIAFLAAGFLAAGLRAAWDFLAGFADFLAGTFLAAFGAAFAAFLPTGFLGRVRAKDPLR
jgi:hypothetical protein